MSRRHVALALLSLCTTAACYSYQTIPVDELRPDLPVRLRVKPDAAEHVAEVVGYPAQDVTGRVTSVRGDTILLAVRVPMSAQASPAEQIYQRLDVPVSQLIEVQQRRLNRAKTYACIALGAAGAGALAVLAFTSSTLLGSQSTPPVINNGVMAMPLLPPPGVRVPIGNLPLRR